MSPIQTFSQVVRQLHQKFHPIRKLCGKPVQRVLEWIPVSCLGLAVVGPTLFVMKKYGAEINDRIILVGGMTILGVAAACAACVLLTALWYRFRPEKAPSEPFQGEVGIPFQTGFRLGICAWNPLLRIEVCWDQPFIANVRLTRSSKGLAEEVVSESRGLYDSIPRKLVISDVLGLSRCVVRRRTETKVIIKPTRGSSPQIDISQQSFTSEQLPHPDGKPQGDLIETRRYSPGDPLKLVMWKVYARTGQLLVRSAERTASSSQKAFVYFVAAEGDEPTASTARAMLESGRFGTNLLFGTDGAQGVARTDAEAVKQVIRSAGARERAGRDLGEFLSRSAAEGLTGGVLFVPPQPGAWLENVTQALAGYAGKIQVIVGTRGSETPNVPSSGFVRRALFQQPSRYGAKEDVQAVRDRLAGTGVAVTVVG